MHPIFDLVYIDIVAEIVIDETNKIIEFKTLICHTQINDADTTRFEYGSIIYCPETQELIKDIGISLEDFVHQFFGTEWNMNEIDKNIPYPSFKIIKLAKLVAHESESQVPRLIGRFYPEPKNSAATIIQKYFKGWKARMQYRYNPNFGLCRYLINKDSGQSRFRVFLKMNKLHQILNSC